MTSKLKQYTGRIVQNTLIAQDTYEMVVKTDEEIHFKPGQFLDLTIEGFYLRRPISICDAEKGFITLIYKVFGQGTRSLSSLPTGSVCKFLAPLGNGFQLNDLPHTVQLIGGGVGVPPLFYLARKLIEAGHEVVVILGFRSEKDAFYISEFKRIGCKVKVCTEDGSLGTKGFVTELIDPSKYVMTCGPLPMLKALSEICPDGQYSLEARMGCGFGACMGCSIETRAGSKQVCKDGPVFMGKELVW